MNNFRGFGQHLSPLVIGLLCASAGVYFLQLLIAGDSFVTVLGLVPARFWGEGMLWQPVTGLLLHSNLWSLLMDLLVLWFFAPDVEEAIGRSRKFATFFLLCGVISNLVAAILAPSSWMPILGPGGAIFGILTAYATFFPERIITLLVFFVIPVEIKAKFLVLIFGAIAWLGLMEGKFADIARYAALAGIPIGFALVRGMHLWKGFSKPQENREQFIQRRVDPILEKIARRGIHSLTWREKRILRKAKSKIR